MDSKKPNPFGELLKKLVFEDAEAETDNETEEILHTGTEAEFEFGADNYENEPELREPEDMTFSENEGITGTTEEAGEPEEDVPDFLKEFEKEAEELAKNAEDLTEEPVEPIIPESEDESSETSSGEEPEKTE